MAEKPTIPKKPTGTRHLNLDHVTPFKPKRGTGPLDFSVPWIVEMRVIGTASVIALRLEETMLVGRSDKTTGNEVDIDLDPYNGYYLGVSRRHAVVSALNSRVTIKDLNSSNGTFINGAKLEAGKEFHLHDGDQLSFGNLALQVSFVVTPSSHEKNDTQYNDVNIPVFGSGQRVMLVDEDVNVRQTFADVLKEAGLDPMPFGDITDALTACQGELPQAVITTLMTEERDALELIEYIRGRDDGKNLPLIVISSNSGGYQEGRATEAGVDALLTKPVGIDELLRTMRQAIPRMPS